VSGVVSLGFRRGVTADRARELRDRWSTLSLATVWPAEPRCWHTLAVDAVVSALVQYEAHGLDAHRRQSLIGACQVLGQTRAMEGISLDEARDDVSLVAALVDPVLEPTMLDGATMGWIGSANRWEEGWTQGAKDGRRSVSFLVARLEQVYAEAAFTGGDVSREYALAVVEDEPVSDGISRFLLHETLHAALHFAFIGGETRVTLAPGRVAALVERAEPRLSHSLAVLAAELSTGCGNGTLKRARSRIVRLPRVRGTVDVLLSDLAV
jgi:hypothetical protein